MPKRNRLCKWIVLMVFGITAPACVFSGAAPGGAPAAATPATAGAGMAGGQETAQGAPTASQTAPPGDPTHTPTFTPTFTIAHLVTPPGPTGTTRYITDFRTKEYAPQKKAIGGDEYHNNRFERPFTADAMDYLGDVDLTRVELKIAAPWIYLTFEFVEPRAEGIGQTMYGAEFDLNRDGRGDYLIWGASPKDGNWTTDGVEVRKDANFDVGGATPQASNAPSSGGDGYDEILVASGAGNDPDLAWIRQVEGGKKVQLALKYSALGNAPQFLWNGLADAGIRNPAWFDYNDHFTQAEAGSPLPVQTSLYPVKAMWGLDNTCRDAFGFTPAGTEPGLCMYYGTISGTLFLDGTCENLAAWHNGVLDPGEPGSNAGQIQLGQGACPSTGYRSATPGADGQFVFADLPIGTYCVSHVYAGWIEYTTPNPVTVTLSAGGTEVVHIGIYVELGCPPGGF